MVLIFPINNKLNFSEHNISMIYFILLIFFILIFPFIIEISFFFEKENNKLYFSLYLFSNIKVFCGYFTLEGKYFALHLKKRAFLFPFKSLITSGSKYKKIKDFEIFYLKSNLIFTNSSNNSVLALVIYNFLITNFGYIFNMHKNFAYVKNDIVLYEQDTDLKFFLKVKIAFNMLVIIIILIKKLLNLVYNGKKTKKS